MLELALITSQRVTFILSGQPKSMLVLGIG
jgi:hypothetical protein